MDGVVFFHIKHYFLPSCASTVSLDLYCLNIFLPILISTVFLATKNPSVRK
jgi:hypothetical protein